MEENVQKAAMEGDTASLIRIIEQDPLILERRNSITTDRLETPLHIASMLGHEAFAAELLKRKPGMARELDATRSSALHLASAIDSVGIVRALLKADPDTCTVPDRGGRNPVHVAAMNGSMGSLKEMLKVGVGGGAARAVMRRGGTVLHLCVEYSQLEALELLVENGGFQDLINGGDRNGNTMLHLAVAHKQLQITEYLVSLPGIDLEALNSNGMTAMDILIRRRTDEIDLEIEDSLTRAGAVQNHPNKKIKQTIKKQKKIIEKENGDGGGDWLEKKRSGLMVVASLIATMAFQFAVTPPESILWTNPAVAPPPESIFWTNPAVAPPPESIFWTNPATLPKNHKDLMYYVRWAGNYLKHGERFYTINTASFVASLSVILLLMSGLPLKNRVFMWFLLLTTWVAISGIALSYALAVVLITPASNDKYIYTMFAITVFAWICLVSLLLILHTIRLLVRMFKGLVRMIQFAVRSLSPRRRPVSVLRV